MSGEILVFDRPGGVGAALSEALAAEGRPAVVDVATDRVDMRAVRARVVEVEPSAIVVASGFDELARCEADPDLAFRRNAEAMVHFAAAALERGVPVVLLSPAELYGQRGGPFVESDEPAPPNAWAASRKDGERLLRRALPGAIVVRTGPIVAPGVIAGPLEIADAGRADPVDVRDVAHAIARLLGAGASGLFHLGAGGAEHPTRAELAALAGRSAPPPKGIALGRAPLLLSDKLRPYLTQAARPWREGFGRRQETTMGHKQETRRVDKPWGYEIIWAHAERYVGKLLFIKAGERLSLQYHQKKDETIYMLSGRMVFEVGPQDGPREDLILRAGDAYRVTPGTVHRMIALDDTQVLEASTPELDDVVRLEDKYGRAGTSAP